MKRNRSELSLAILLLFMSLSCTKRQDGTATATIPPASPRPAPTTITTTIPDRPVVETRGSPPPFSEEHADIVPVIIRDDAIRTRELLPRLSTAFRITNGGTVAHGLVIEGRSNRVSTTVPLAPGDSIILQMNLIDPVYELMCPVAGHRERASIRTYRPR